MKNKLLNFLIYYFVYKFKKLKSLKIYTDIKVSPPPPLVGISAIIKVEVSGWLL